MLFQELCEAGLDWDDPLSPELLCKWQVLVSGQERARPISIRRCYFEGLSLPVFSYSLQRFCDASKAAYAAVVYLLVDTGFSHITRFVACKTRVSPLKEQTIPCLELLLLVVVSVSQALEPELPLGQPNYFTDSKVALFRIKGQIRNLTRN